MQNSSVNQKTEFVRLSVTLFLIAGIMALLVAFVNNITAPVITQQNEQKTALALQTVLPEADEFISVYYPVKSVDDVSILGVYRAKNNVGYCVNVAPKGYGGDIEMIVGFDSVGAVTGVKIVSMSETSGIGTKIAEPEFIQNFIGRTSTVKADKKATDKDTVQIISGATKSSKAFVNGINVAIDIVSQLVGGGFIG